MEYVSEDRAGASVRWPRHTIGQAAAIGLSMAVIGSVVLASTETGMAAWFVYRGQPDAAFPFGLVLPALGRAALTHLLLWCPLLVLLALLAKRLRGRARATPEAILWGIFVLTAGLVVVPADLALAGKTGTLVLSAACMVVVVLAAMAGGVVAVLRGLLGAQRFARIRNLGAWICAGLALVSGVSLARSPLLLPGDYRVRPPERAATPPRRPNVVLIVLDTVRPDRMSCYGYDLPTTPFLDEWARHAIVYERVIADGIWTVPSHASMFTGMCVRQHGAHNGHMWLDDEADTVAELLESNGYATAAFVNNNLVSRETNLLQGFATASVVRDLGHLASFSLEHACERLGITPPVPWLDGDMGAALTNQMAAQWLKGLPDDDTPFFLLLNYMEAHLPYRVPKRYRRMFMTEEQMHRSYDLRYSVFGNIVHALGLRFVAEHGEFVSPADREVAKLQYMAGIRYLDDRVAEIIDVIERQGSLDDTLVIITSDHGEYLDSHGMWAHRFETYNEITNACLLIREPRRRTGLRIRVAAQLSDLYPTIANAALRTSVAGPGYRSRDLISSAEVAQPSRIAITEFCGGGWDVSERLLNRHDAALQRRAEARIAVTDGGFKYIISHGGQRELYDLRDDPGEQRNLIEQSPLQASRLADYIESWAQAVPIHQGVTTEAAQLSEKKRDALRALGYLDDG